jgi:hypothetical protein
MGHMRNAASRAARCVFETTPLREGWVVLFRMVACPVLMLLVAIDRARLPGWEMVLVALAADLAVNLVLHPMLGRGLYLAVAALGTSVDTALLLALSNVVIRGSAARAATSEMWLVYPLLIIMAAYRFRPVFSLLYTLLLTAWYSAHIAVFFPPGARSLTELPLRAGFFLLIGVLATLMAYALRRERAHKAPPSDTGGQR